MRNEKCWEPQPPRLPFGAPSRRTFAAPDPPNSCADSSLNVNREGAVHCARSGRAPMPDFSISNSKLLAHNPTMPRHRAAISLPLVLTALFLSSFSAHAEILWSNPRATLAQETGAGKDILNGAARRDDTSSGTLYFKFHVDPLSDVSMEEYFAGFQLFENNTERLGIGNSPKAWAYSAFNTSETGQNNKVTGDMDLRSSRPEAYHQGDVQPYELPRRGIQCTIVFKVEFVPGADDRVTVWMNPTLSRGATEENQLTTLVTHFR